MDRRALIGPSPGQYESDDNQRRFAFDKLELEEMHGGKGLGGHYLRNNSFSLDSGQGGHHSPRFLHSPFPLPVTRIDGSAYINPVYQDDYPSPSVEKRRSKSDKQPVEKRRMSLERPKSERPARRPRGSIDRTPAIIGTPPSSPRDRSRARESSRLRDERDRRDRIVSSLSPERARDRHESRDERERRRRTNYSPPRSEERSRDRSKDDRSKPRERSRDRTRGNAGRSRLTDEPDSKRPDRTSPRLKRRLSRSEDRSRRRRESPGKSRKSGRSLERTLSRMSSRSRQYSKLKDDSDSDYQNGDYRSDNSLPPEKQTLQVPRRQHSITTRFSHRAMEFIHRRMTESTSSRPTEISNIPSDITDDSVFMDDSSVSPSLRSDTSRLPIEPVITVENETLRSAPTNLGPVRIERPPVLTETAPERSVTPRHFTFDDIENQGPVMNGDLSPPLSPASSDLEDLPDVITSEDTDDMIVMLLSNRSPCVAKLMMFCGVMQMFSGFITMISGASGFLSDITVFNIRFDSPIAFWCGALFVFSGAIGIKTSHTKRRSMNLFSALVSFTSCCSAIFVLIMTADPQPIRDCALERRLLYYFHLFLMNVEIMASAVLCFMCFKSLMDRKSSQPSEIQVLKTLSKYGLKPEHSVPQMAAAQLAAASRPTTPTSKTPLKSPANRNGRSPNRQRNGGVSSTSSSKTDLRYAVKVDETKLAEKPVVQNGKPGAVLPISPVTINRDVGPGDGPKIQPPPDVENIPDRRNRSKPKTNLDTNSEPSVNHKPDRTSNGNVDYDNAENRPGKGARAKEKSTSRTRDEKSNVTGPNNKRADKNRPKKSTNQRSESTITNGNATMVS